LPVLLDSDAFYAEEVDQEMTRVCARCSGPLEYPVVTLTFHWDSGQESNWFCSKPHALEYLEQDILDDAKELSKK
jgi:hypothetical protein